MAKITKQLCFLSIGVIILIGLYFVDFKPSKANPSQLKTALSHFFKEQIGLPLVIKGPLVLKFQSGIFLEASNIKLHDPKSLNKPILTAKTIRFKPRFLPLIFGKCLVDIELQGANIYLERQNAYLSNWKNVQESFLKHSENASLHARYLMSSLKLIDGTFAFHDAVNGQSFTLLNINLESKNISKFALGYLTTLTGNFQYKEKNKSLASTLTFSSKLKFYPDSMNIHFEEMDLSLQYQGKSLVRMLGQCEIQNVNTTPLLIAHFNAGSLPIQSWLSKIDLLNKVNIPNADNMHMTLRYQAGRDWFELTQLALKFPNGIVNGRFTIIPRKDLMQTGIVGDIVSTELNLDPLQIADLKTHVVLKEGVIDFSPIDFTLANAKHRSILQIDLKEAEPKFNLTHQAEGFNIEDILVQFNPEEVIEGITRIKATMRTEGRTLDAIRKNLIGQAEVEIEEGSLHGIDILSLLNHTQSTMKMIFFAIENNHPLNLSSILNAELREWKEQAVNSQNLMSPFKKIAAKLEIKEGVLESQELKVIHPLYSVDGKGTLDLENFVANYQTEALLKDLSTHVKENVDKENLDKENVLLSNPLSIKIQGPLKDLAVRPDLEGYAQHLLSESKQHEFEELMSAP